MNKVNTLEQPQIYHLKNGLRVIIDPVDFFETVSIGFWVLTGSMLEDEHNNGYSHLIEHMLFKGTSHRTYLDIAKDVDKVGGYINAYTTREYTCYYINIVGKYLKYALDILSDMVMNSLFETDELENEKRVIIEEIRMYEDTPEELIQDNFIASVWKNHPIGRPIIGTEKIIEHAEKDKVIHFWKHYYTASNIIITLSGNVNIQETIQFLEKLEFSDSSNHRKAIAPANLKYNIEYQEKKLEQVYLCMGFPGIPNNHPDRYSYHLFSNMMASGSSSILFLELREKRGLCYSITSFNPAFKNEGIFAIFSSTSPQSLYELLSITLEQLETIKHKGVDEETLLLAKEHVKGNIIFSRESLEARMSRLASNEIVFGRQIPYHEIIKKIEEVSLEDIQKVIDNTLKQNKMSLYTLGTKGHSKILQKLKLI